MPLIDIAAMYKRIPNPRKPFSYFFSSRGYTTAYNYLRDEKKLPEHHILVRAMPSRGNPSVARVHPLVAVEFLRWVDYDKYYSEMMRFYQVDTP